MGVVVVDAVAVEGGEGGEGGEGVNGAQLWRLCGVACVGDVAARDPLFCFELRWRGED